jgi:ketosteroid isomerase-like protein
MTTTAMTSSTATPGRAAAPPVAQVRRYYDLVDAGDVPGLVGLFTADATYHRPGYEPLVGHAELTRFYGTDRVIKEGRHTISAVVATGEDVAVHGEFHGVLHDGREVGLRFADFFIVTPDGRFSRRDTFFFAPLV